MGLLIGLIQRRQLKLERSHIAFQMLVISKAMATAHKSAEGLMQVGTDYQGDPLITKKLQERQYKLKLLEDELMLQKEELQTRLDEIKEELQSVEQMIQADIKETFSFKYS